VSPGTTSEVRPLAWFALAAVVLVLDQITKAGVMAALAYGEVWEVLPPWLYLTRLHNPGAAFSMLADAGGWQRWALLVVGIGVSAAIAWWLWRQPGGHWWQPTALALILGWALGNLVDRALYGHVVDFVQVYLPFLPWRLFNPWPAFNVADSAISVGAVMLVLELLRPSAWREEAR
jgi:signal peptidase II